MRLFCLSCECLVKKLVVEKDPTEKGDRALLNFGHTIGHAIEKYKNGDNNGAIEIVQNTLKTNNVDIEKMQKQTENYIKGFMNR